MPAVSHISSQVPGLLFISFYTFRWVKGRFAFLSADVAW